MGRKIGKQDHFACCYGNINNLVFKRNETVVINPIVASSRSIKTLEANMIMFYTNQKRNSETVLKNQYRIKKKQFENLKKLKVLVGISKDIILNKNFRAKNLAHY